MKYRLNACTFPFSLPNEDLSIVALIFIEKILETVPDHPMNYILQCIQEDLLPLF